MTFAEISLKYCLDVVNDTLPYRKASRLEKLACERQLKDLQRQKDESFPYYFDEEAGNLHCQFMSCLRHVKGQQWVGKNLVLEPHQVMMHHTLFAWKKKHNGYRRFSKVYWELPRKNGKSYSAAGIGLYIAFAEGEAGSEVYAGATTLSQACMVFEPAWMMVNRDNELKNYFNLELSGTPKNPSAIYRVSDMSRFVPVVGKPGDGASVNCGICDEYHEHSTSLLLDTFTTGTGSRLQSLIMIITTAGFDTSYPCYEEHLEAKKILEGSIEKEHVFPMIFGIDEDDEWSDFEVWKKANPNYGVSIPEDNLREFYQNAITSLKDRNVLLCKHLNKWMNAGSSWMDMQKWEMCKDENLNINKFEKQECFVAIDLASKIDLAAMMFIFKTKDNKIAVFGKYYLPEETIEKKENSHYRLWRDEGILTQTEGARTDFQKIENDLEEFSKKFVIKELAFDPKEASYLIQNIQKWANFECVEFPQGPTLISEPMKELEARIYANELVFNGDKLLTWTMGNVVKKQAKTGGDTKYFFPVKQTASNKIDPVVSLIMALGRMMSYEDSGNSYEDRVRKGEEQILRVL